MKNRLRPDTSVLEKLGYTAVTELTFTFDHPDVELWTNFFENQTKRRAIFETFWAKHPIADQAVARIIGTQWHRFSTFMPWFLCQASALMPNNTLRHYAIQTAYEELGMRNSNEIHADLFWRDVEVAGVTLSDQTRLSECSEITAAIQFLRNSLLHMQDPSQILGIMLGLEIPARENIESVFRGLAHTAELEALLAQSKFFVLHRQIEIEHVRLNVANFLRFCPNSKSQTEFLIGFKLGLDFWEMFWSGVSTGITKELKVRYA